ncbi:MAG: SDR family oxidoreductase, partial [Gemmatimonadales bacterium]|jgi:3-oxoacyl-[acyl-carrier protein] reductase
MQGEHRWIYAVPRLPPLHRSRKFRHVGAYASHTFATSTDRRMDLGFNRRVALVCGSSRGLGYAIATRLAAEGCAVALNGRDPRQLADAVARLGETHDRVTGVAADVTDPQQIATMVQTVEHRLGPVDVLVCNAGGPPPATFASAPDHAWREAVELNLLSTVHLCRAAVPGMRERGWGRVVCITSFAAREPVENLILSTTARAGVLGFAKALADEVAADGVTVNVVCPGWTHTERVDVLLDALAERQGISRPEVVDAIVRDIPAGRMGQPRELAAVVAFLASDVAGYVTGITLNVDGGLVRSIL